MEIVFIVSGFLIGGLIVFFALRAKLAASDKKNLETISEMEKSHNEALKEIDREKSILSAKYVDLQAANQSNIDKLEDERKRNEELSNRNARAEVEYKNLKEKLESQRADIEELQKKFTLEFENVASKILKENTKEFSEFNQKNLGDILNPLKEKILVFEKKVEDTYQKGLKDQTDLKAELKKLHELNNKISEEANNLTRALKSDSKKQGNWGEIILERVLERSGLIKGQEYDTQVRTRNEDGATIQPDVIIHLPENKHLIIDSKVSLLAYEAYTNEENETKKESYLKQHLDSIKTHVKGLSEKNYQNASLFDTPDFVLLFMPIESAFSIAIQADPNLFNTAWEKKIVIVSPTTLLATLSTVASIWKHEKQTQNAIEIARQGGALYDKFVGFLKNMDDLGQQLARAGKSYEEARNKLVDGKGNLIKKAEDIRKLGAKASKSIPDNLIEKSNTDNE